MKPPPYDVPSTLSENPEHPPQLAYGIFRMPPPVSAPGHEACKVFASVSTGEQHWD